jgi:hypothetical protein
MSTKITKKPFTEEELTKIVFNYASSHMMKKDLELSIKIMGDVIRHPQFYLNI